MDDASLNRRSDDGHSSGTEGQSVAPDSSPEGVQAGEGSVAPDIERKRLAVLQVRGWPLQRTLPVVHHRHKYLSKALVAFLDELKLHVKTATARRKQR